MMPAKPAYYRCLAANTRVAPSVFCIYGALGEKEGTATFRSIEESKIHAPGWESTGPEFGVMVTTIDAQALYRLDLIKVDVDGAEHHILKGAAGSIGLHRPFIYVEHDKPHAYPDMIPWLDEQGYRIYQHNGRMFNPRNFRGNPINVFGAIVSMMLLAVPNERKDINPGDWGLERVRVTVKKG